jgi:heptosyltransferase I
VLVGARSPRELRAEATIAAHARRRPRSALGSGLRRLVSILDGAAVALSPDTGPLHMAVALQRPVISLMGYTNPKRTGPYRRYQDLIVDAYGDPGEDYPPSLETRPGRMTRISVRDVLEKVELWRSRYSSDGARQTAGGPGAASTPVRPASTGRSRPPSTLSGPNS